MLFLFSFYRDCSAENSSLFLFCFVFTISLCFSERVRWKLLGSSSFISSSSFLSLIIIIIMYIYHALINALSAQMSQIVPMIINTCIYNLC